VPGGFQVSPHEVRSEGFFGGRPVGIALASGNITISHVPWSKQHLALPVSVGDTTIEQTVAAEMSA